MSNFETVCRFQDAQAALVESLYEARFDSGFVRGRGFFVKKGRKAAFGVSFPAAPVSRIDVWSDRALFFGRA
jgi:hypothetical protein